MTHLALALLGPFQATLDGEPAEGLNSDYLRALLAYLAVEGGRDHPREVLAALLWPERSDREALSALRYALSNLHGALGDREAPVPYLLVTRSSVQLNPASDHWLDVAEFKDLATRSDVAGLEQAVALYRGPFLHGLSVGDSPAFDEWTLLKGEEYQRVVLSLLGRLTSLRLGRGDYGEAARWARRQLELEPYREQAHRQLMMALALRGERPAALTQYEACRRLLAQELGCEPEDETQALYAQIQDGGLCQPWTQPQTSPSILSTPPVADAQPPYRVVARERELARLKALLEQALAGQGGVALIAGEAGAGKTALLDEWARRACRTHGDLIVLRGRCNAHGGAGDPYLPFREILQTLAGDVESKRAAGPLSPEQARRAWEALPAVGAALVAHGPDLIDTFVPGEALLRRIEGFPGPPGAGRPLGHASGLMWQARLREILRRAREDMAPTSGTVLSAPALQPDLFAQVTQVLHAVAVERPLLLMIDDLQWADGGTTALLFHLGRRLGGSRILLACAYRPEALQGPIDPKGLPRPLGSILQELIRAWGDVLVDLDRADGRAFVEAYIDSEPNRLGAGFRQALYEHTGGNPLFTVELVSSMERDGTLVQDEAGRWVEAAAPDWGRWPPRVEAVVAGHLATLPDEDRALLQVASIQGERFAAEVAARVLGWDEGDVVRRLSGPLQTRHRLVEAISLDRLASTGQRLSRYRFRHALVQASAYCSLDAVARARRHEATGRALEAIYAPVQEEALALAPELARHFEAAGMPLEAARYRLEAGRWSVRVVAYEEAIAHLECGLALLEGVPASRERLRLELALLLALVNPAVLQQGFQSPTVKRALARLFELGQHPDLQDDPQRLTALVLLALASSWSADPERGQRVGEQLLDLAQDGDPEFLMLAHWVLGHSHFVRGQFLPAREHLSQALALYDPEASRSLGLLFPGEPGVIGRAVLGLVLWLLGHPHQGRRSVQQALALAQEIEQPRTTAFTHVMAGTLYSVGRDETEALKHGQALQDLGEVGQIYLTWAELLTGQAVAAAPRSERKQGLAQAGEAESAGKGTGSSVGHVMQLLAQAQTLVRAGQAGMALEAVDQALAWIEHTGVRVLEAEVWRVRGELLLKADEGRWTMDERESRSSVVGRPASFGEAEACFHRALEITREQGARWLELRAAVSLARLWQRQGRRGEARELLADIYGWFTEGFDTLDLVEAKALLEELA
jgi:DNA-binding SARP family transcriptional activator